MQLSAEHESKLIEQNMPKIYRALDNFMARCKQNSSVQISDDDCVQEVSIAFLNYITYSFTYSTSVLSFR